MSRVVFDVRAGVGSSDWFASVLFLIISMSLKLYNSVNQDTAA
jgi:hypothetical protein